MMLAPGPAVQELLNWLFPVSLFVLGGVTKGLCDRILSVQRDELERLRQDNDFRRNWLERSASYQKQTLERLLEELLVLSQATSAILTYKMTVLLTGASEAVGLLPDGLNKTFVEACSAVALRGLRVQDDDGRLLIARFNVGCQEATGVESLSQAGSMLEGVPTRLAAINVAVGRLLRDIDVKVPG